MSLGNTSLTEKIDFSLDTLVRFSPVIFIVVIRCLLSINPDLEAISFYMAETILIPFLLVLSASSLRQGSRNIGFIGIAIGLGTYLGALYLGFTLPVPVLVQYPVQATIAIMLIVGSSLLLFSTTALGLWISKVALSKYRLPAKIAGAFVALAIVIIWLREATIFLTSIMMYPLGLPSTELYYYMFLIFAGCFFIPRRQGVTVFYFMFGLVLSMWGLLIVNDAWMYTAITGHYFRVVGTMCYALFAVPLGSTVLYLERHPENKILIALPLWFFAETLTGGFLTYPLSMPRVFLVGLVMYVIVKEANVKEGIQSSIISLVSMIGGAVAVFFGSLQLILYRYFIFMIGPPPQLDPISAMFLSSVGLIFCMYGIYTFGAFLRKTISTTSKKRTILSIVGSLMAITGLALGVTSLLLFWPPFYISDILFIILVGFGATLVTKTPGRLTGYAASLGFAISVSALYSLFYETVVFTFYPAMTAMIFFGILHYRTDSKPKPPVRLPSTRRVQTPTPPEIVASDEPAPTFKPTQQVRPVEERVEAPIASQEMDDERMARNWYNRAVTFREEGVIEEAIRSVETALKWVPDHKEALALWKELQDEKRSRQFENQNQM